MTDAQAIFQTLFDAYVDRYLAGDALACAEFYAEDGQIHSPFGPPVVGRAAIAQEHLVWFQENEVNKTVTILEARAAGDIGFALAEYGADVPQEDGSLAREEGTSLNSFERGPDGTWRIRHTSLNAAAEQT